MTLLALSCAVNWTAAFLVGKIFPLAQKAVGEYVFIFFAAVSLFCFLFLGKFGIETKGKTFSEIDTEFAVLNGTKASKKIDEEEPLNK